MFGGIEDRIYPQPKRCAPLSKGAVQSFDDIVLLAHLCQRLGEVWFDTPLPASFIFRQAHPLERLDAARDELFAPELSRRHWLSQVEHFSVTRSVNHLVQIGLVLGVNCAGQFRAILKLGHRP